MFIVYQICKCNITNDSLLGQDQGGLTLFPGGPGGPFSPVGPGEP